MKATKSMPRDRPVPEGALAVWVIYHRPRDYPHGCVLRCQYAMSDGTVRPDDAAWFDGTVEALRKIVPPGLVRMERHHDDDPHIVETWL